MEMTRKQFCSAVGSSTVLLFLQACGGGGSYGGAPAPSPAPAPPPPGGLSCGASGAAIAGNHGHVLVIAAADLDSAVPMTYGIEGSAGHNHFVSFTPAQLQMLKAGGSVTVLSTTTDLHEHNVTANCM